MTKSALALVAVGMAVVTGGCGEEARATDWKTSCPIAVSTTQSIGGALPPEWSSYARSAAAMLPAPAGAVVAGNSGPVSVSVFDGPPQDLAELVPDDPNARRHKWSLGKDRKRDIFLVCNYADTRMKLARKVPAEVRMCTVDAATAATVGVTCR